MSSLYQFYFHLAELGVVLHGVQLLTTEMVHLVHQMQYYMTFEVLECSWHGLMTNLKSAQSLDDVIAAHNEFLKRIVAGALLDSKSKVCTALFVEVEYNFISV